MVDPTYFDPFDLEESSEDHTSEKIFPELGEADKPVKLEWEAGGGLITMMCGCHVEVYFGDTVWLLADAEGVLTPIAVDPVTLH